MYVLNRTRTTGEPLTSFSQLMTSSISLTFWKQATVTSQIGCKSNICTPVCLNLFYVKLVCTVREYACMSDCACVHFVTVFSGCVPWRTVFWAKVDIRLSDIGGDSSTVAYGNRLLTAKIWHQRKQVSQAWHSVLLRGLRNRLSAYGWIIKPITNTIISNKEENHTK